MATLNFSVTAEPAAMIESYNDVVGQSDYRDLLVMAEHDDSLTVNDIRTVFQEYDDLCIVEISSNRVAICSTEMCNLLAGIDRKVFVTAAV